MANVRPLAEMLSTRMPAAAPAGYPADAMQKAAQESAVGGLFETLTKEAKEDLFGTTGYAGHAFGSQVSAAMEPTVTKLAEIQAQLCYAVNKLASITSGGIADIGGPHMNVNPTKPSYPNEKGKVPDNADAGDGVKGWAAVSGMIEKLKTQSTTTGTVMGGKKRMNPGQENIGDYPHGKKANFGAGDMAPHSYEHGGQAAGAAMEHGGHAAAAGAAAEGGENKLQMLLELLKHHGGQAVDVAQDVVGHHPAAAAGAAGLAGMLAGRASKTASAPTQEQAEGKRFQAFLQNALARA